jgi:nicotinate dehydrogenase subunit B
MSRDAARPQDITFNPILSRWIGLDEQGSVTLRIGKVELGQGVVTAIAALAADELRIPLASLRVVAGDTRSGPDEGLTAGSLSLEQGGAAARWAAALARDLFAEAAARHLDASPDAVQVEDGQFFIAGSNTRLSYADLRDTVELDRDMTKLAPPTFVGLGHDLEPRRLDLAAKYSGAAFIHDLDREGMLHGRVLRPSHPFERLKSIDRQAIERMPGVRSVVIDGSFAGVVADREDLAEHAVEFARGVAQWERERELPADDATNLWMLSVTPLSVTDIVKDSDWPSADPTHRASYSRPYLAHTSIGPSCALAEWRENRLSVWSHTQGPFFLRDNLARALNLETEQIDVIHTMGAGCYGHNGADDVALDAALLARSVIAPVLVRWSRTDELTWSPFGAPMRVQLAASLKDGRIAGWSHDVFSPPHLARPLAGTGVNLLASWGLAKPHRPSAPRVVPGAGTGDRNAVPLYEVGVRRVTHHLLPQGPLRSSALRSLGAHGNVFAIESFMDELAEKEDIDPLEFRLHHLKDPRARTVIEAVRDDAGWKGRPAGGDGSGWGVGFARYKNTGAYFAVIVGVEVTDKVRLTKVHAIADCGAVVYKDAVENQLEGGIFQAASWTLKESVRWDADGVLTRSWGEYPTLRFSECPPMSIRLIDRADQPPLGAGECAAGPVAAAIGNAVACAVGVRVRNMPITADRIAEAIHAA